MNELTKDRLVSLALYLIFIPLIVALSIVMDLLQVNLQIICVASVSLGLVIICVVAVSPSTVTKENQQATNPNTYQPQPKFSLEHTIKVRFWQLLSAIQRLQNSPSVHRISILKSHIKDTPNEEKYGNTASKHSLHTDNSTIGTLLLSLGVVEIALAIANKISYLIFLISFLLFWFGLSLLTQYIRATKKNKE